MYRKFKKVVLGLPEHVTLSIFSSIEYLGVKLQFTNHIFFRTAVLRKLFDIRFSYNHCNFSRVCLLVKMASKTVTRSIVQFRTPCCEKCFAQKTAVIFFQISNQAFLDVIRSLTYWRRVVMKGANYRSKIKITVL